MHIDNFLESRHGFRIEIVLLLPTIPLKELEVLSMLGFFLCFCGVLWGIFRTFCVIVEAEAWGQFLPVWALFLLLLLISVSFHGGLIWELTDDLEHRKKASC